MAKAKASSGAMGLLALMGIAGGGVAAYLLLNKSAPCNTGDTEVTTCSDGSTVITKNCVAGNWVSTGNTCPVCACVEGTYRSPTTCWDGSIIYTEVCHNCGWTPSAENCPTQVCVEGTYRNPTTCWDGSTVYGQECVNNQWVNTGLACPICACTEGTYQGPTTCWDGSIIYAQVCHNCGWTSSGETCPTQVCVAGTYQDTVCPGGSTIHSAICQNNAWVPTGTACPTAFLYDDFEAGVLAATKWTLNGNLPTISNVRAHGGTYSARTLATPTAFSGLWTLNASRVPTLGVTPGNLGIALDLWVYINAMPTTTGTSRSEVIIRLDDASNLSQESAGPHVDLTIDAMYARWDLRVDTFVGGVRTTTYYDTGVPWVAGQWTHITLSVSNPGTTPTISGTIGGTAFSAPALLGSLNSATQYLNTLVLSTFISGDCFWDDVNVTVV